MSQTNSRKFLGMIDAVAVARPQIFNFNIKPPSVPYPHPDAVELSKMSQWGWVSARSLTNIVGQLFKHMQVDEAQWPDETQQTVFEKFGSLNGHKDGKALHTYIVPSKVAPLIGACTCVVNGDHPMAPVMETYVPARWANAVIDMAYEGIIRVTVELGAPNDYYTIGHTMYEKKKVLVRRSPNSDWYIRDN